jgi:hypothetical protein
MDQLDPIQAALLALDFQNTASTLRPTGRDHVLVIHVGGAWPGSPEMNLTAPLSHVAATGRWRAPGVGVLRAGGAPHPLSWPRTSESERPGRDRLTGDAADRKQLSGLCPPPDPCWRRWTITDFGRPSSAAERSRRSPAWRGFLMAPCRLDVGSTVGAIARQLPPLLGHCRQVNCLYLALSVRASSSIVA